MDDNWEIKAEIEDDEYKYDEDADANLWDEDDFDFEDEPKRKRKKISNNSRSSSPISRLDDDNIKEKYIERLDGIVAEVYDGEESEFYTSPTGWKLSRSIYDKLYDFQKEGVKFLQDKYDDEVGCILADEMGLGKSIQTVAFLRSLLDTKVDKSIYGSRGLGRALLICNNALLQQWISEFHKWFPQCRVFVFHKCSSSGVDLDKVLDAFSHKEDYRYGCIFITTYKLFVMHSKILTRQFFQVAILDEGHQIKNKDTKTSLAVKKLITTHRILLTGTPMQNHLGDLWNLIDFIFPGKLGCYERFNNNFIRPITEGSHVAASKKKIKIAHDCTVILQEAIKPYMLRRTQDEVKEKLDLPEKDDTILYCKLTRKQEKLYESYLFTDEVKSIVRGDMEMFKGINKLGDICNHPGIFKQRKVGSDDFGSYKDSGKLVVLFSFLKKWLLEPECKVLIFTKRLEVTRMLTYFLNKKKIENLVMTGSTSTIQRSNNIKLFAKTPSIRVMLMTTRAGGTGLNLTMANKVVIFDPDWNPTADRQAKERAYRIGQKRDVTIYRLVTDGTVEEKIYNKQTHKEALTNAVVDNAEMQNINIRTTVADLFKYTPKTQEEFNSAENRIQMNKVAAKTDKNVLSSLFKDDILAMVVKHRDVVKDQMELASLQLQARSHVIAAASTLVQSKHNKTKNWKEEFQKSLKTGTSSNPIKVTPVATTKDGPKEKSSLLAAVGIKFEKKDESKELTCAVKMAHDIRKYLKSKKNTVSRKSLLVKFPQKHMSTIEVCLFEQMINTLATSDKEQNYTLKKKYM